MSHETEHRTDSNTHIPSVHETHAAVFPEKTSSLNRLGRKGQVAIGGLIAGVLVTGGLVVGNVLGKKDDAPTPDPKPTAEAPVVPGPVETPVETTEPSPAETEPSTSLEVEPIPADASAEVIAQSASNLWNEWSFTGATDDTIEETNGLYFAYAGEYEAFFQETAEANSKPYLDTFFVNGWETNPALAQYYDTAITANIDYLQGAVKRFNNGEELLTVSTSVSNVVELPAPEGQRIIQYDLDGEFSDADIIYRSGQITETYDISDGTARLLDNKTNLDS